MPKIDVCFYKTCSDCEYEGKTLEYTINYRFKYQENMIECNYFFHPNLEDLKFICKAILDNEYIDVSGGMALDLIAHLTNSYPSNNEYKNMCQLIKDYLNRNDNLRVKIAKWFQDKAYEEFKEVFEEWVEEKDRYKYLEKVNNEKFLFTFKK